LKARQVRELSDEEHATGQLDDPHKLAMARREIARLLTVRTEREHANVGGGEG